jgi:hypothetical protein
MVQEFPPLVTLDRGGLHPGNWSAGGNASMLMRHLPREDIDLEPMIAAWGSLLPDCGNA